MQFPHDEVEATVTEVALLREYSAPLCEVLAETPLRPLPEERTAHLATVLV